MILGSQKSTSKKGILRALCASALLLSCIEALADDNGLVAKWSFDEATGAVVRDTISGTEDKVEGFYKYVQGVSGTGLRLDGYTTSVVRKAKDAPKLREAFTVEAWVALNTYPWNWVPVVDQEETQQAGYFFGIDAFGHIGLQVAVNGVWQSVTSEAHVPLKRWAHIAGTFDQNRGLAIYMGGKEVGRLRTRGEMARAEGVDVLIGRIREPTLPFAWLHPKYPVWYSLDAILDEVRIYSRSLTGEEVEKDYAAAQAPSGEVLPWPVLPSGPPGAGRFGAYYATLKYQDTWDRMRRIGPDSDVVVRFDRSPIRLVFWQGTNYVPAWVTENNRWYSDQFLESWGKPGCQDGEDCEPMSDKQCRYSRVRILESNEARAVVHWRYALSEVEHYKGAYPDPLTGWFEWADEYWTVYPDGVAVRKMVLWSSDLTAEHQWQETIVIDGPGQRPEDNINTDALTLANMEGQTATYSWVPEPPERLDRPTNPNIQIVNLKSTWKPFQIIPPVNPRFMFARQKTSSIFEWWNHWPVAQIASSGRFAVAPDRAGHSSLSSFDWDASTTVGESMAKVMMDGLTIKSAGELLPLAKSWLSPPKMQVAGRGFRNEGYDPAQRAFLLVWEGSGKPSAVELTLQANQESPVVNPAIVIKNWCEEDARLTINGNPVVQGKDFRLGHVEHLEGVDLVVWVQRESSEPLSVEVAAPGQKEERGRENQ